MVATRRRVRDQTQNLTDCVASKCKAQHIRRWLNTQRMTGFRPP